MRGKIDTLLETIERGLDELCLCQKYIPSRAPFDSWVHQRTNHTKRTKRRSQKEEKRIRTVRPQSILHEEKRGITNSFHTVIMLTKAMLRVALAAIFLPTDSVAQNGTIADAVGDPVCVEGFVMDWFCIERGTLLDNNDVVSLLEPERHSVHCLVDISSCINSGYEVLVPPPSAGENYCRGFRLDDAGNTQAIEEARSVGMPGRCTTCTGSSTGPEFGFSATVRGTVQTPATDSTPAIISVESVVYSGEGAGCGADEVSLAQSCSGCGTTGGQCLNGSGQLTPRIKAHGSLMIAGWGAFLPAGVITAKLGRHRPNGLWFKIHRAIQTFGLVLAIAGWGVALASFDVFGDQGSNSYRHGVLGMTTMILGILQPLNAFIRPHAPEKGEEKPKKRFIWEIIHKGSGYVAVLLALATIGLGTTLVPDPDLQQTFQIAFGVCSGVIIFGLIIFWMCDKKKFVRVSKEEEEKAKKEEEAAEP